MINTATLCPCCSNQPYQTCCEPFIARQKLPQTPQQLMRSRYTAYKLGDIDYIEQTSGGDALQAFNHEAAKQWASQTTFSKLQVVDFGPLQAPAQAYVEFKAFLIEAGKPCCMHEKSIFERVDGRWYYTGALSHQLITPPAKVGRNELCPCGSGRKFKKCCMQ